MVIDVIFLQDTAAIVVEVDADLFSTVNTVSSQSGLTAGRDPHTCQRIRVDLVTFDNTTPIIMLYGNGGRGE